VRLSDRANDGQAQARTFGRVVPGAMQPAERFEHLLDPFRRHLRTGVPHGQSAGAGQRHLDVPAGPVVPDGVVQQVGHQPFQQHRVTDHGDRLQIQGRPDVALRCSGRDLADQGVQGHRFPHLQAALALGQGEEAVEQPFGSPVHGQQVLPDLGQSLR